MKDKRDEAPASSLLFVSCPTEVLWQPDDSSGLQHFAGTEHGDEGCSKRPIVTEAEVCYRLKIAGVNESSCSPERAFKRMS
jgi:hypothetical protein